MPPIAPDRATPPTKRKKSKRFLEDKNDALALAASIAGVQEEKAVKKVQHYHQTKGVQHREETKRRPSSAKAKLNETKALLAAKQARAKREKAKARKQQRQPQSNQPEQSQPKSDNGPGTISGTMSKPVENPKQRKRVSFA